MTKKPKTSVVIESNRRLQEAAQKLYMAKRDLEDENKALQLAEKKEKRRNEELERELAALDRFSSAASATWVAARMYGRKPLKEAAPDAFHDLADRYSRSIDLALDRRVHKVDHDISAGLRAMAEEMGAMCAGPRDVIDVHKAALTIACAGAPEVKSQVITEEARFLLVELMGYLVSFYQTCYTEPPVRRTLPADNDIQKREKKP
jgi:hypothetical protein